MKRLLLGSAVVVLGAAIAAIVSGSAANLGVTSKSLTTFTAAGPASGDTAAPGKTAMEMFDVNSNGRVDRVVVTFDENVQCSAPCTAPWQLVAVPSGGTLSSVAVSGTSATLTLTEGAGDPTTAVGSFTVALSAQSSGIRDSAGNQASFAATAPTDKAAPVLRALELFDVVAVNGRVDRVEATFSETLLSTTSTAPWALTNVPSAGTLGSVSTSGNKVTLALTEGTGDRDTAIGSMTVALTASTSGVQDASLNVASFAATAPSDKASPHLTSLQMFDADVDGRVDLVEATFSEEIAAINANTGWTLTNVPSGGVLVNVSSSGAKASLAITEGVGAHNTAVGTFRVALASGSSLVKDKSPNANVAAFAATAPTDAARPLVLSLDLANSTRSGKTAGKPEEDDVVTITFSEPLLATSVCSTGIGGIDNNSPVVVSIGSITGNDVLRASVGAAACGGDLRFGSIDLGSNLYTDATFSGSGSNSSTVTLPGSTFRLELGTPSGGTHATVAESLTATYTPDGRLSDAAGNFVIGTISHTGTHF